MSEEEKPRVGLISVSLPRENPPKVRHFHKEAMKHLGRYVNVISVPKVAFDASEVMKQYQTLKSKNIDCLIFVITSWIWSSQVVTVAQEISIPIGIWAIPSTATGGLIGAAVTHGSLEELGIEHTYFYGWQEDKEVLREIMSWARAASTIKYLQGQRFGLFGGLSMGMYTAMVDFAQVQSTFGVEIKHFDQLLLVEAAERVASDKIARFFRHIKQAFGQIYAPNEVMRRSIRLYLAAKKIIREEGLAFVGIKCQPELIENYVSACLPIALLNDDGIVAACEADVNGALTMQILHLLSNQPALLADLSYIDKKQGILTLVNCGSAPPGMAKDRKEVNWGYQYQYMGKNRGATTVFCCKSGLITLARLVRIKGDYFMFYSVGYALEDPKEQIKNKAIWPHAFIKLRADPVKFIYEARSNHIHMIYGDYRQELSSICRFLKIHPLNI